MPQNLQVLQQKIAFQIEEAFAETPYPGDTNIGHGCGWEGALFELALRGKHWKELTIDFIFHHRDEIPCMTLGGFRFYLPAFMLAVLLQWEKVDKLSMNLILNLTPPNFGDTRRAFGMSPKLAQVYSPDEYQKMRRDNFMKKVTVFSRSEKAAIFAFLETYPSLFPLGEFEHDGAKQAAEFWKNA